MGVEGGVELAGEGDGGGLCGLKILRNPGLRGETWGTRSGEEGPAAGGGAGGGSLAEAGGGGGRGSADLRRGSIMERSWSKPSAEASPAVASSQRAVVVWSLVRPERRWRSAVKAAPCVASRARRVWASGDRDWVRTDSSMDLEARAWWRKSVESRR